MPGYATPNESKVSLSSKRSLGSVDDLRERLGDALTAKQGEGEGEDAGALAFFDQDCLQRYHRAYEGNVSKAAEAVLATKEWRMQTRPWASKCDPCAENPEGHSVRHVGFDKHSRPIGYINFWQATNRFDPTSTSLHMFLVLESIVNSVRARAEKAKAEGNSVGDGQVDPGQVVWICDFDGFGLRDCANPMLMLYIVRLLAHYPERLALCVLLNSPMIFSGVWKLVEPVLPPATRAKIQFVSTPSPTFPSGCSDIPADHLVTPDPWLLSHLGDAMATWVTRELLDNANPLRRNPLKHYWEWRVDPRYAGEVDKDLKVGDKWAHDARGEAGFVASEWFKSMVGEEHCFSIEWEKKGNGKEQSVATLGGTERGKWDM